MPELSLRHQMMLGLTLGVGVGLSVIAALFVGKWEASNHQVRFQRQIENLATVLQRNLNRYTDILGFLSDHYAVAQGQVTRQEFATFVARSRSTYPGVQALEWAPLVRQGERKTFEQTIQAEGYSTFQITELSDRGQLVRAGDRPVYLPVTYIVPFLGNEAAFGYDLNSSPARAAAMELARSSGQITVTERIRLVQEQRNQFGFLVFFPLSVTTTVPNAPTAREQQFQGFLLGVFRVSDVIEEALRGLRSDIDFALYDQSADVDQRFLGRYDAIRQDVTTVEMVAADSPESNLTEPLSNIRRIQLSVCPVAADCHRALTVGQRQWLVAFSPSVDYALNPNYGSITTLLVGLLLTASLIVFLHNINHELEHTKTLSHLKLRFFSMASHELRTPLSTILLSSESLQMNYDELSEEQKLSNIQRIHLTAQRMSQQITDLLTLTRAEVGKLEFNPELLDLEQFCKQVIEEVQTEFGQPIAFINDCHSTKAFWDKKLARSLLSNLLSNAVKYSSNDVVQFTLQCDVDTATIQICDRGIGIPVADQPQIQEPFQRGSNVGTIGGTGLGLAVVKTSVELHRGQWVIDSMEGKGTTVTVKLPLE